MCKVPRFYPKLAQDSLDRGLKTATKLSARVAGRPEVDQKASAPETPGRSLVLPLQPVAIRGSE